MDLASRNKLMAEVSAVVIDKILLKDMITGRTAFSRRSCADAYNQDAGATWIAYGAAMGLIAYHVPAAVTGIGALVISAEVAIASVVYVNAIAQYEDSYQDCMASSN